MKKSLYILLSLLCISIALNVWQCSRWPEAKTIIEHDTLWRDSVIYQPAPTDSSETGRVVYIRVAVPGDTIHDTIPDSIDVPVPIMQKRYDDSLYTAWVSGYHPALDSISLHLPEVTTTITQTIIKPSPRLSFGIQGGAGFGIFSRQPDIYLGVGVQLRLWTK